jgi:photosystem II stability/assembly factor-like uncharacterized protein
MNKTLYIFLVLLVGTMLLSACQPAVETPTATATAENTPTFTPLPAVSDTPGPAPTKAFKGWKKIDEYDIQFKPVLVGFDDKSHAIALGKKGEVHYTSDAAQTWPQGTNKSLTLYGLEIVSKKVAYACGNGQHLRITTDGGATWKRRPKFGGKAPDHCRLLSFVNKKIGWAATPVLLGTTNDGGKTWITATLPQGIGRIEATSLFAPGQGFLLDAAGKLYATQDNGLTWSQPGGIPLGNATFVKSNSPSAAMRFSDAGHGMAVVAVMVGDKRQVIAFHTADGGLTWSQEVVPAPYGIPYLSHDGQFLTLFNPQGKAYLLKYSGE